MAAPLLLSTPLSHRKQAPWQAPAVKGEPHPAAGRSSTLAARPRGLGHAASPPPPPRPLPPTTTTAAAATTPTPRGAGGPAPRWSAWQNYNDPARLRQASRSRVAVLGLSLLQLAAARRDPARRRAGLNYMVRAAAATVLCSLYRRTNVLARCESEGHGSGGARQRAGLRKRRGHARQPRARRAPLLGPPSPPPAVRSRTG